MSGGSAFDKAVGHTETKLETESYGLEQHFPIIFPLFSHSRGQAKQAMPHFQKTQVLSLLRPIGPRGDKKRVGSTVGTSTWDAHV